MTLHLPLRLILLGAVLGAGCAETRPVPPPSASSSTPAAADLAGSSWRLTSFGAGAASRPPVEGDPITAVFTADGRVGGASGCNRYNGLAALGRSTLAVSNVASTRRMCDPASMSREQAYLAALDGVRGWTRTGDRLDLTGTDGVLMLRFTADANGSATSGDAVSASLTGEVYYRPRIALAPTSVVTVRLVDVSRADAASVTIAEQRIETAGRQVPIPFALAYDPAGIDARNRYAVRAEIRNADGTLAWTSDTVHPVLTNGGAMGDVRIPVVQVSEDAPATLGGTSWRLVRIDKPGATPTIPRSGEALTLTFGTDGRAYGQADCNRFNATYEAGASSTLTFGESASTLAACPPGSASGDYLAALGRAERYAIEATRLRIVSGAAVTLTFEREGN